MPEPDKLPVAFTVERRGTGLWFRNAAGADHIWHGPYADTEAVAEMLCFYMRENLLDRFERLPEPQP